MHWTEVKDYIAFDDALGLCRGVYQQDLLAGIENLSGSTFKGRAKQYGDRYARSRQNLLTRIRDAGILVSERKGKNNKRILVIGE